MAKRKSLTGTKKRPVPRPKVDLVAEAGLQPEAAPHPLLSLQRQLGNTEVARMLARRRGDDESRADELDADRTDNMSGRSRGSRDDLSELRTKTTDGSKAASPAFLQRVITKKLKDGSISLDASSQLFQGSKQLDTVKFAPGAQDAAFPGVLQQQDPNATFHGTIRTTITANWDFEPDGVLSHQSTGNGRLVVDAPFRIPKAKDDDDSAVKFKQPRVGEQESNGDGAALDPQPQVLADSDDSGGSLTVSPRVTYQEQNASQGQLGFTPFGLGVSGQKQSQTTDTQAFGESFTVSLNVTKPAPGPKPDPQPDPNKKDTSPKVLKRFAMVTDFGVNKRVPSSDEIALLKLWWNGVAGLTPLPNKEARDAVRTGQTEVFVVGHASRTGSREYNLVLSKDRADSVVQVLQADDVMGGGAQIDTSGSGLDQAKAPGEAQSERNATTIFEALVSDDPKVTASTSAPSPGPTPIAAASNDTDS